MNEELKTLPEEVSGFIEQADLADLQALISHVSRNAMKSEAVMICYLSPAGSAGGSPTSGFASFHAGRIDEVIMLLSRAVGGSFYKCSTAAASESVNTALVALIDQLWKHGIDPSALLDTQLEGSAEVVAALAQDPSVYGALSTNPHESEEEESKAPAEAGGPPPGMRLVDDECQ